MTASTLDESMQAIARRPGIEGCGLVDMSAGFLWASAGQRAGEHALWEAAVEFWRLHQRNAQHFVGLGPLGAAVTYYANAVLAVMRCCEDPDVLLVVVGAPRSVDWIETQRLARQLGAKLGAELRRTVVQAAPNPVLD